MGLAGAAFLLALAAPTGAARAAARPSPVTLQVTAGYNGMTSGNGWIPVNVSVTNSGPDLKGTLVLTQGTSSSTSYGGGGGVITLPNRGVSIAPIIGKLGIPVPVSSPGGGPLQQRQSIVLPAGTTKHFQADMPAGMTAIQAQVLGPTGKTVATAQTTLTTNYGSAVAVVSDSGSALGQFAATSASGSFPGPGIQLQVIHLTPATLPDSTQVLASFPLIAIDNATTSSLTAPQKAALEAYVQQGGSLLVTGGDAWQKTAAGLPANLVALAPTGTQPRSGLPSLAASLGANPLTSTTPVDVAVGQRTAGSIADLSDGTTPILLQVPLGAGQLFYATPDLAADPIASWSGTPALLRQILSRASSAESLSGLGFAAAPGGSIQQQGPPLYSALANIPSLDLPSPALIAVLLVVFVLLVGPVNYVVLHRVHRPDAAWVTIPLIVVFSGGSIYAFGLATRGTNVLADRIREVYLQPGAASGSAPALAYVNSATGVFSPHTGNHLVNASTGQIADPSSGSPITTVGDFSFINQNNLQSQSLSIDAGPPAAVRLNWPVADSIQSFGQSYNELVSGGLAQHITVTNGRLTGTVTNHLPVTISDAVVMSGDAFHTFGAIRPGQSVSINLPLPYQAVVTGSANSLPDQIYLHAPASCASQFGCSGPGTNAGTRPSVQQREAQRRDQVLGGILEQNSINVPQPLFVAWATTPEGRAGPVLVDGKQAQLNELDAFVLPLQPQISGATLLAGVIPATAVDNNSPIPGIIGNLRGGLFLPGGTVTEQFALPGPNWSSLSLTMGAVASALPGLVMPPGSGTSAVSVFNRSTGTWDPIAISQGQTVALPVANHVSPDGLVLVKLTSSPNGMTFATDLEISGQMAAS
ncbi:MAG TPA: hypothetical protein VFW71_00720 [Actinomycetota bacterium]|nr:hypothetical protein [Actinomycetota bacterium]